MCRGICCCFYFVVVVVNDDVLVLLLFFPRNLPLKFRQNWMKNRLNVAFVVDVDIVVVVVVYVHVVVVYPRNLPL